MNEETPLRKQMYRKLGAAGFSDDIIAESNDRLASCLARVEKALAADGPHILGEQMTIADIVLLPTTVRMIDIGMADRWARCAGINRWLGLMMATGAFAAAYPPGARFGTGSQQT